MRTLQKTHLFQSSRRRRGFTLVEMFIVGALIALFSSLAVFGVQQQFNSNIRKAAIGESRNIASALDFANLDTSIFPRLCWLPESRDGLDFIRQRDGLQVFTAGDIYGRPVAPAIAGETLRNTWEGPYFALSQSRRGVSQGRTGVVSMAFAQFNNNSLTYDWPSDPYGTPYTVYMLDIDLSSNQLRFVTDRDINDVSRNDPTEKGNFVNAIVSYGLNLTPGGDERTERGGFEDLQLFTGISGRGPFIWRNIDEFRGAASRPRANAWSREFASTVGGTYPTGTVAGGGNGIIGISDPESDDIVFEF